MPVPVMSIRPLLRRLAPLAAAAAVLAGCGAPTTWERDGATPEAMRTDFADCRQQARQEAFWRYSFTAGMPMMGPTYWGYRNRPINYLMWRQNIENDRFFYENRLAAFCMRNKGYSLVEIDKDAPPPATKLR